jgi:peptidoglycan/LPS O-acetylase OafA/YrhL
MYRHGRAVLNPLAPGPAHGYAAAMSKLTAAVLTGLILGVAQGIVIGWGEPRTMGIFMSILGRASQGIVTGLLAAYVSRGRTPMWRAMLLSGIAGLALGGLAGIPEEHWKQTLPMGAIIGIVCGIAAARGR